MTKHLLVDLENIQPAAAAVADWIGAEGKAWIFYGPLQRKLLAAFEALGVRVTLIPISRPGANSLDFHLVFYLGYLAAGNPDSQFTVLSKDKGYNPAIAHARLLKFMVKRIDALPSVACGNPACHQPPANKKQPAAVTNKASAKASPVAPAARKQSAVTLVKKKPAAKPLTAVYRNLRADLSAPNRPKTLTALKRHIQTKVGSSAAPARIQAIIDHLRTTHVIQVVQGQLKYPAAVPAVAATR